MHHERWPGIDGAFRRRARRIRVIRAMFEHADWACLLLSNCGTAASKRCRIHVPVMILLSNDAYSRHVIIDAYSGPVVR
jgi:hypothetical protein